MFDACVVGSGPGGVFAARGLRGRRVLVLDAGIEPPAQPRMEANLYDLRRERGDLFQELIGEDLEGLRHIFSPAVSMKLKSPGTSFVAHIAEQLTPVVSDSFQPVLSLAEGGLANAWGAGVYRFQPRDLAGFPLLAGELSPYYDEVGAHMGVSGEEDDLAADLGREPSLQPPLRLSRNAARILAAYGRRRAYFQRAGVSLGRSRLAMLTRPHNGREPYAYRNLEFFQTRDPAIYNPAFSLREMVGSGEITYERGWLVTRFEETGNGVRIHAVSLRGGGGVFNAAKLLLAAGAINSARIALASRHDFRTRLPVMDNPIAVFPLLHPRAIGTALETRESALAQLNLIADDGTRQLQGSIYGATGALRSDLIPGFPLPLASGVDFARLCAPALTLLMLFYPETPRPSNYLQLRPDGTLRAAYEWQPDHALERRLCAVWRRLGVLSLPALIRHVPAGGGIHYAGTMRMRAEPGPYECHPDGRLSGTRHVYLCDGSVFPWLPAKNLTYTLMALALRTASLLRERMQ